MRLLAYLLLTVTVLSACGINPTTGNKSERPYLRATPEANLSYVSIVGDAYTSGSSAGGKGPQGWPLLVKASLQKQGVLIEPIVGAKEGSGYGKHGAAGNTRFIDQVRRVVGKNNKLVVLFGSSKDQTTSVDNLTSAIQRTVAKVRQAAPKARILMIGPAWVRPDPSAELLRARDVTRAQAEVAGADFVDPLADKWFADRPHLIGTSGQYPNDAGHVLMAEKLAPVIAEQLTKLPPDSRHR